MEIIGYNSINRRDPLIHWKMRSVTGNADAGSVMGAGMGLGMGFGVGREMGNQFSSMAQNIDLRGGYRKIKILPAGAGTKSWRMQSSVPSVEAGL